MEKLESKSASACSTGCPVDTVTVTSEGNLPAYMALAAPYVPFQKPGCKLYESDLSSLAHGTIYPALFLPFKNMYKVGELPDTPLTQLMALEFALVELGLYLDTHPNDTEALEMRREYVKLHEDMLESYQRKYGPVNANFVDDAKHYSWVSNPWPWNVQKGE